MHMPLLVGSGGVQLTLFWSIWHLATPLVYCPSSRGWCVKARAGLHCGMALSLRFKQQFPLDRVIFWRSSRAQPRICLSLRAHWNSPYSRMLVALNIQPHAGINNRMQAWDWVASEMRTHVGDANWLHADSLDSFAGIFPNAFTLIGNRRFPLYVAGSMAQKWFDSWKLINEQRVARHGWPSWGSNAEAANVQPPMSLFQKKLCSAITLAPVVGIFGRVLSPPFLPVMCGRIDVIWQIHRMPKIFVWRCWAFTLTCRSIFRFPSHDWIRA